MLALATLLQAYCHVGDRDAVELTVWTLAKITYGKTFDKVNTPGE